MWRRGLTLVIAAVALALGPGGAAAAAPAATPGALTIGREIDVGRDRTVREVRTLRAEGDLAALWRAEVARLPEGVRQGWTLETRDEGGAFVVIMTRQYRNLEEFNSLQPFAHVEVISHPLYETFVYTQLVPPFNAAFVEGVPVPPGMTREQWLDFLKRGVQVHQEIRLPGRIESHNLDQAEDGTLRWVRPAGDLAQPVELKAQARTFKTGAMVVAGAAAVLLIGGPIAVVLTRRWWDPDAVV